MIYNDNTIKVYKYKLLIIIRGGARESVLEL